MYITRYIEETIRELTKHFKVLYLGGPRQVGKTTVLQQLGKVANIAYVTLDDLELRDLARRDPQLFLERFPAPLFVDEVQYAPNLFPYIKMRVDKNSTSGQYWLSGSQHLPLLKGLQESLAGRVGLVSLLGFSFAEEKQILRRPESFLPTYLHPDSPAASPREIFSRILRGSYPALVADNPPALSLFYNSYVQTYLDRDVRDAFGVDKIGVFKTILELVAARTGQILNISELARDAGASVHAVRGWISILETSGIIYLLRPYARNRSKRLIKAPKLYMLDTGLTAYLTKWKTVETLESGAASGAFFETYTVGEIVRSFLFRGLEPPLYYFRDREGREVDLLIEEGNSLYPIEIKMRSAVQEADLSGLRYVKKLFSIREPGTVITLSGRNMPYDREINTLPVNVIQ